MNIMNSDWNQIKKRSLLPLSTSRISVIANENPCPVIPFSVDCYNYQPCLKNDVTLCAAVKSTKLNKLSIVQLHNLDIHTTKAQISKIQTKILKLKEAIRRQQKEKSKDSEKQNLKKNISKKQLRKLKQQRAKLQKKLIHLRQVRDPKKKAFRFYRRYLIRKRITKLKSRRQLLKREYRKTKLQLSKTQAISISLLEGSKERVYYTKKAKKLNKAVQQLKIKIAKVDMRITELVLKHSQNENVVLV